MEAHCVSAVWKPIVSVWKPIVSVQQLVTDIVNEAIYKGLAADETDLLGEARGSKHAPSDRRKLLSGRAVSSNCAAYLATAASPLLATSLRTSRTCIGVG